jgi:putative NADPH-quinone reductase
MGKHIAIIQGHPDASVRHYEHALADEYAKGTEDGGHEVRRIEVAQPDFPLLWTKEEFENGELPLSLGPAREGRCRSLGFSLLPDDDKIPCLA